MAPASDGSVIFPALVPVLTTVVLLVRGQETAQPERVVGLGLGVAGAATFFLATGAHAGDGSQRLAGDAVFAATGFDIGIEFSDGWRPYRARLKGEHVPIERESEPEQFAIWVARHLAHERLHGVPYLTGEARPFLGHVLGSAHAFVTRESHSPRRHWSSGRIELPGHRPVSAKLAP